MNYQITREKLIELVAVRVDGAAAAVGRLRDNLEADASFSDLEVDSLSALDLCLALEDVFDHPVEPSDLVLHPSVNALAHHLSSLGNR